MRLDIIRDDAGFAALESSWDTLLEQSSVCTPFMRWDWLRLWWEEFHTDFSLAIAVVRDEAGAPQGIAPLMIGADNQGMRRHLRHLGLLGGLGEARGERMDFLVPAGREHEITPILCRAFSMLGQEWDAVRLNKIPEESPNLPHIMKALAASASGVGVLVKSECACIRLNKDWAAFESAMLGRRRRLLRRRRELMNAQNAVGEHCAQARDAEACLEALAVLHRQHYPEGVSSFLTERSWRFHQRLGRRWIGQGRALLPYLTVDGEMVGAVYGFMERDEFFYFQSGWKRSLARFSPGHQSLRWALECCMQRGLRLFDLLPGVYRYKREWAHTSRYVTDVEAYRPHNLRAAAFRCARQMRRMLQAAPKEERMS